MSYQIASSTQSLLRTASVPSNTNFSACGWVNLSTPNNNYNQVINLDASGQSDYIYLGTPFASTELFAFGSDGAAPTATFTLTVGQWYFVALSAAGASGALRFFYAAMPGTPGTVAALNTTTDGTTPATFTVARFGLGANINESSETMIGSLYNWKVWSGTVLTQAEFLAEANNFSPQKASPWAWYHLKNGDTNADDQSGNGRNLSAQTSFGSFTANPTGAPQPPATNLAPSVSDAITTTETTTLRIFLNPFASESVTVSDTAFVSTPWGKLVSDAVTVSDAPTLNVVLKPFIPETITTTELVTVRGITLPPFASETITTTDTPVANVVSGIFVTDAITTQELTTLSILLSIFPATETISVLELTNATTSSVANLVIQPFETITVIEASPEVSILLWTLQSDSVTTTDSVSIGISLMPSVDDLLTTTELTSGLVQNRQNARPIADLLNQQWDGEDGSVTNLYSHVNEAIPNNANYVRSPQHPINKTLVLKLAGLPDPLNDQTNRVVVYYGKDLPGGEQLDLTVNLRQGYVSPGSPGTLIALIATLTDIPAGWTPIGVELPEAVAATITDFTDLSLELIANAP